MLGWMKRDKSTHPMADERGAREFLLELPANDPFRCLEELAFWLDATRTAEGLKPQRIYEIIDQLDQAGRSPVRRFSQDYLAAGSRLQKFQEQRIWTTVVEFLRQLGAAYEYCLTQPDVAGALKLQQPMLAARAIRAMTQELKWALLRYGPVDPTLWGKLAALYRQAEEGQYATRLCPVYPGPQSDSTVQREYLRALMLGVSACDSLQPRKLEIAERIVTHFAESLVLRDTAERGCYYQVDLAVAKPPERMVIRVAPTPQVRHFGPGAVVQTVENLIESISVSGAVPSDINLGGNYETQLVIDVLRHLMRHWGPNPPTRADERQRAFSRISVVHDFEAIAAIISGAARELSFYREIENWTVDNESGGGYGAVIQQASGDWLKVGVLLGIKLSDGRSWSVGIVRRLATDARQQRYVGIQLLARGATGVTLLPLHTQARGIGVGEEAVLLPSQAEDSASSAALTLLMRLGTFAPGRNFAMQAYQREYLLIPLELLEAGQDFDMARFRVAPRAE